MKTIANQDPKPGKNLCTLQQTLTVMGGLLLAVIMLLYGVHDIAEFLRSALYNPLNILSYVR